MGTSVIANGLNTLVKNTAKLVGKMQIGINKILWGVNNRQPSMAVKLTDTTTRTFQQDGQLESESTKTKYAFTQKTPAPAPPGSRPPRPTPAPPDEPARAASPRPRAP